METKSQDAARELAMKIYVELVARNTEVTNDSVKLGTSAANMATLSLRLAEAFFQAEAQANAAKEPVKDYKLPDDMGKWSK